MVRNTLSRRAVLGAGLLAAATPLTGFGTFDRWFAPRKRLWPRWTAHDPASKTSIDHADWDAILARYLRGGSDGIHRFAYGEFAPADRARLDRYLSELAAIPIRRYGRDEQRAYWINLYNALTISLVLDHYPVASIRDIDISPGLFANGPWDKDLIGIEGERLSLNDIEHRILRPIWNDPRIHYAVNCAALGCPNLQPVAFTAANGEELMEKAARDFVNDARGARASDGRLIVSSIYVWFTEDFGGTEQGVLAHLRRYAAPELAARLAGFDSIDDHAYDWRLNDIAV